MSQSAPSRRGEETSTEREYLNSAQLQSSRALQSSEITARYKEVRLLANTTCSSPVFFWTAGVVIAAVKQYARSLIAFEAVHLAADLVDFTTAAAASVSALAAAMAPRVAMETRSRGADQTSSCLFFIQSTSLLRRGGRQEGAKRTGRRPAGSRQ